MIDTKTSASARRPDVLTDSLIPLRQLEERGREQARASGTTASLEDDVRTLRDFAIGVVRDTEGVDYDPKSLPMDAIRDTDYQNDLALREEGQLAVKFAQTTLHERSEHRASVEVTEPEPTYDEGVPWIATGAVSVSLGPTLHDRFFATIVDQMLSWAVSVGLAAVFGLLVTWMILGTYRAGRRTAASVLGLVAGIGVGFGAFLIRVAGAGTAEQFTLAAGLSALEIVTVLFLEHLANKLRDDYRDWREKVDRRDRSLALEGSSREELQDRVNFVSEVNQRIGLHQQYVESRHARATKREALEQAAVAAVLRAYQEQVDINAGRTIGRFERVPNP